MSSAETVDTPEFHLVVRHPNRRGPLAPYRFTITVVFALVVSGGALWDATDTGVGIDMALLRIAGSALLAWIIVGRVSKILASSVGSEQADASTDAD
jgi:hypothetical protein